jgi:hypothetical protein
MKATDVTQHSLEISFVRILPPFPVLTFYKDEDNTPFPPKYSRGRESRCCTQAALASSRTTHAATTHRTRSLRMAARSHP